MAAPESLSLLSDPSHHASGAAELPLVEAVFFLDPRLIRMTS